MSSQSNILLVLVLPIVCCGCQQEVFTYQIGSPNKQVSVEIKNEMGKIQYSVLSNRKKLVNPSELSIFPNATAKITSNKQHTTNTTWQPTWGQFSEVPDNYNELVLDVAYPAAKAKLYVRLYDQGVGFRYVIEEYEEGLETTLFCQYNLSDDQAIYSPSGEQETLGSISIGELKNLKEHAKLKMPIVVEKPNIPYLSLLESDLFSAPGFEVILL